MSAACKLVQAIAAGMFPAQFCFLAHCSHQQFSDERMHKV